MQAINDCTREAGEAKDGRQHMQEQVEALKEELKLKDIANEAAQVPITPMLSPLLQPTS